MGEGKGRVRACGKSGCMGRMGGAEEGEKRRGGEWGVMRVEGNRRTGIG